MRDHNRQRSSKFSDEESSDPEDMLDLTTSKSPNMPTLLKPPPVPKKKEKTPSKIKSEPKVTDVASPKKAGPKKTSQKKLPPPPKTAPPAVKSPKRAEKRAEKRAPKPKNNKADLWAELAAWAQKMSKAERSE